MTKESLRSWFAELLGSDTTKPETRARLAFQPLDNRDLPTVMGGFALAGSVYVDSNCNGVRDCGEAGIANVRVAVVGKDACGNAIHREACTDTQGNYAFRGLPAGCYTLTETQPSGFRDGRESGPTTATANDTFGNIRLSGSPRTVGNYNFGEIPAKQDDKKGSGKKGSSGKGSGKKGSCKKASGGKGSHGKGSGGKASGGKGSGGKGSGKKGSCKKASGGKGSHGKGSSKKGSGGKCDIWVGYAPKKECDDKYKSCGYGYQPCDDKGSDGKGSGGKGSSKKGSSGKGSGGKGSSKKGSCKKASGGKGSGGKGSSKKGSSGKGDVYCGVESLKAQAASTLSALYGIVGKVKK